MFTPEERERVRSRVFELARGDGRITGGALTGSVTVGAEDRWSDVDTSFGVTDGVDPRAVLDEWTPLLDRELHFLHHFDLAHGPTLYRVFLLPTTLELDIALTPAGDFGARGPNFRLVFGESADVTASQPPSPDELIGYGWLYAFSARAAIARGKLWQAESFVEAVRNYGLALACLRHDLPTAYARGVHRLEANVTAPWEETLVRSLDPHELRRALAVAARELVREVAEVDLALANRLREPLRAAADAA
jgi:hypothetical protein